MAADALDIPEQGLADHSLDKALSTAIKAAREAGKLIRQAWWSQDHSHIKDTKSNSVDLVTEADVACEQLITRMIQEDFPNHRIIGEESCGTSKYGDLTMEPTWTIDPIDGTTNFIHRFPQSCVIISYLEGQEVLAGVVYDPVADELFYAKKGAGAHLESPHFKGQLFTSKVEALSKAVIGMEVGYGRDEVSVSLVSSSLKAILERGVRSIRMGGSTGLNMAYVAAGRLNAAFEHGDWDRGLGPKIWDFSAGKLLVSEAGGVTRDLFAGGVGELNLMGRSQFSSCTTKLADEIIGSINFTLKP